MCVRFVRADGTPEPRSRADPNTECVITNEMVEACITAAMAAREARIARDCAVNPG